MKESVEQIQVSQDNTEQKDHSLIQQAKLFEAQGFSRERALEIAIGKARSLHFRGNQGEDINVGPLGSIADLAESTANATTELLLQNRYSLRRGTLDDPWHKELRQKTDMEKVRKDIETWIEGHSHVLEALDIENWRDVTPWQGTLLSIAITHERMRYDKSNAEILDTKTGEQLLEDGDAQCRHYAAVEELIFNTIKDSQEGDRLDGSIMLYARATLSEVATLDVRGHAYNILVVGRGGGGIDVAAIDPTWSDFHELDILAYSKDWEKALDKFYPRMGHVAKILEECGLLHLVTTENQENLLQWLRNSEDLPSAALSVLSVNFLSDEGSSDFYNRGRIQNYMIQHIEKERKQWKGVNAQCVVLFAEVEALQRSCARWDDVAGLQRGIWEELEQRTSIGAFDVESLWNDPGAFGYLKWSTREICENGYNTHYERMHNLPFARLNALLRILRVRSESHPQERSAMSFHALRSSRVHKMLLSEYEELMVDLTEMVSGNAPKGDIIEYILGIDDEQQRTETLERTLQSYQETLMLFLVGNNEQNEFTERVLSDNTIQKTVVENWAKYSDAIVQYRKKKSTEALI